MKNLWKIVVFMLLLPWAFIACSGDDDEYNSPDTPIINPTPEPEDTTTNTPAVNYYTDPNYYAGFFAYNILSDVYLWKAEIASAMKNWLLTEDAIEKVDALRYKENGEYVDKWTQLTNDYESFIGGVDGAVTTTFGVSYQLNLKKQGSDDVVAFVLYTYPDSPAANAGLKRGDVVVTINGKTLDLNNYMDLYNSASVELGLAIYNPVNGVYTETGKSVSMTAVNMYENPVLMTKVFDCGGKKVGYLAYTSFTLDSCKDLIDAAKSFKEKGVTELILDLRYNGGGYVITENLLASLLAPQSAVTNKEVFETEIWNQDYMDYYKQQGEDLNTYFQTEYEFTDHNNKKHSYNTTDANIGLSKIYALVTESSASASEAVLVGLLPYMDIEIIGEQTHGKYCTGWILSATDWYQDVEDTYAQLSKEQPTKYGTFAEEFPEYEKWETYAKNWGIYVMISRYADKNGDCPCMPNGFTPNVEVKDLCYEPYDLGDDREALLRKALTKAGYTNFTPIEGEGVASRSAVRMSGRPIKQVSRNPLDGKRILLGHPKKPYQLQRPQSE
ncbi:MAG: hypothetical protein IJ456_06995 [Bacteroides sp.]|nr:hypothetical protein [Bacteroides sp.]